MNEIYNKYPYFKAWVDKMAVASGKTKEEIFALAMVREHAQYLKSLLDHKEELYAQKTQTLKVNCS